MGKKTIEEQTLMLISFPKDFEKMTWLREQLEKDELLIDNISIIK